MLESAHPYDNLPMTFANMKSTNSPESPITHLASKVPLSATLEINELVQKRLANGQKVVHLGFGEATFPVQEDVLTAHKGASESTSYLPVPGLPELRRSIARSQSRRINNIIHPEQAVVTPGSKPLLFALFALLDGDVLLPRPSWVSYEPQVTYARKRLFWVETDEEDRHSISESSLMSAYDAGIEAGASPKIMLINNPSNPTGQAFSEDVLNTIAGFCHDKEITLISDEIYSDLCFDSKDSRTPFSGSRFNSEKIILTGGLSKTYSAGGWRIGFGIFPQSDFGNMVKEAVLAYASECWSAAAAPAQIAASLAFDTASKMDAYRAAVASLHANCTLRMFEALRDMGLAVAKPKGAFYLYPSFNPFAPQLQKLGIMTSKQLSQWLIEECGVATLPGSVFGEDDDGPPGGRYRLRMATSYLFFRDRDERYSMGYEILTSISEGGFVLELPLLDEAIAALRSAVEKIKTA